jgi:hypothetical protein
MVITVYNIYSEKTNTYTGEPEQVRSQLQSAYPFLARYENQSLQEDLQDLSRQQALMLSVKD